MMRKNELTWEEVRKGFKYTPEEEAEIQIEAQLIEATVEARKSNNLSQRELSLISGVMQPAIARIEKQSQSPRVSTLIKILYPMGYTLKIVPLGEEK